MSDVAFPNQQFSGDGNPEECVDLASVLAQNADHSHSPCRSCGRSTGQSPSSVPQISLPNNKRCSPVSGSVFNQERESPRPQLSKRHKKLFSGSPDSQSGSTCVPPGFSKIDLSPYTRLLSPPAPVQARISPPRLLNLASESELVCSGDLIPRSPPPSEVGARKFEESNPCTPVFQESNKPSSRPPLPPLRRASSLPSPLKSGLTSSSDVVLSVPQQKMMAMGSWIKDVAKWWDEELHTAVPIKQLAEVSDCNDSTDAVKEDGSESECCGGEESVNVERTGECLIINFKCPCKNGYQILLSGTSVYYKLI